MTKGMRAICTSDPKGLARAKVNRRRRSGGEETKAFPRNRRREGRSRRRNPRRRSEDRAGAGAERRRGASAGFVRLAREVHRGFQARKPAL